MVAKLNNSVPRAKKEFARSLRKRMTAAEMAFWQHVRRKALGVRVHRQYVIRGYIVDFYIPAWAMAIELDGSHHCREPQLSYDRYRDAVIRAAGVVVKRFSNETAPFDIIRQLLPQK